jgi:uncharacterized membrane protein (DUF441 family)
MNKITAQAKAIGAGVLGFVVYVLGRLATKDAVLPDLSPFDVYGWGLLIVSMLGSYLGIYGIPNTTNDPTVAANQSVKLKPGRHALPE